MIDLYYRYNAELRSYPFVLSTAADV